jgi:putative hydrolase
MWEINAGHKYPNYQQVLEAARCGVDFIVNSDAHFPESVGYLDYGAWVVEKCQIPLERVKNARPVY